MPKVSPEVSQLAGKIAEKLQFSTFTPGQVREQMIERISSALAEREQKVGRLVEAANRVAYSGFCADESGFEILDALRTALQEME